MKSSQWILLAGAFFALSFAAKTAGLGAPAAQYMSAAQLAENGSKPGRVNVAGQVLRVRHNGNNSTVTIRGGDNRNIRVVITAEAENGYLEIGGYYSFTGEVLGGDTLVVSLPRSIQKHLGSVTTYTRTMTVQNHVAMYAHAYGTSVIPAPTVPDGTWDLKVVSVSGGDQEAMLP